MSKFQGAMRRVITGDNAQRQSVVIIDGGPSSKKGNPDLGEMFEIWEDPAFGPLTPSASEDLATRPVLGPRNGNFQVRWFVIHPQPDSVTKPQADPSTRERFAEFYGAGHIIDQTLHPGMHETHSIDIICLLQGEALSSSKVAKLDCGPETWSSNAGPIMRGRPTVAPPYCLPC